MIRARPWHRSLLFWLGLPGFLFLLWAWLLFNGMWRVHWTRLYISDQIACRRGTIILSHSTLDASHPNGGRGFAPFELGFHQRHVPDFYHHRRFFDSPLSWKAAVTPDPSAPYFRTSELTLPLWFLTPVYLAAWFGTLVWWQRRTARLLETAANSPASAP